MSAERVLPGVACRASALLEALGRAIPGHDIHVNGHGVMSMAPWREARAAVQKFLDGEAHHAASQLECRSGGASRAPSTAEPLARVGRSVPRNVYWRGEPLFVAATAELAAEIVACLIGPTGRQYEEVPTSGGSEPDGSEPDGSVGHNETSGYAASLRQIAAWYDAGTTDAVDTDELRDAADLIDRLGAQTVPDDPPPSPEEVVVSLILEDPDKARQAIRNPKLWGWFCGRIAASGVQHDAGKAMLYALLDALCWKPTGTLDTRSARVFFSPQGRKNLRADLSRVTPFDAGTLIDDCDLMRKILRENGLA